METTKGSPVTELDGIPIWLLAFMCSLALLGIIYAIVIIGFNIAKAKNKIIKMTSPNINIIMLIGAICGYGCMVLLGLDSGFVSLKTMENIHRATTFMLAIGFTVIYGCLFAKSWRVFLVFKNINFNGKLTRDEHLLIGVLVMIIIDLAILLPWHFVDPIKCTRLMTRVITDLETASNVTYEIDDCHSSQQGVWISLLYLYKLLLTLAGLYFTWQTRHVTLPSLKDSHQIYVVVYTLAVMAVVALPVILISDVGMKIRYSIGALIIWLVLTVTLSLLFMPKILLERKNRDASNNISAFNFLFSESMRKTQEAVRKCSLCFCCSANETDRYAQEMLANEIETLKRTIKQKDDSIRELNDRLYIGTEKFHEYLVSPKPNRTALQAMQEKYEAKKSRSHKHQSRVVENAQEPSEMFTDMSHISSHDPRELANGYPPYEASEVFASTPQIKPKRIEDERYEDEGIHSSDSNFHHPNAPNHFTFDIPPSQSSNTYSQQQQQPRFQKQHNYMEIQTISDGYMQTPTQGNRSHSRRPSQGSFSSQKSARSFYSQQKGIIVDDAKAPSPNQDSAIDDNTPSSDGYDRYPDVRDQYGQNRYQDSGGSNMNRVRSYEGLTGNSRGYDNRYDQQHYNNSQTQKYQDRKIDRVRSYEDIDDTRHFSQIDIGAMEYDAIKNFQRTPSIGSRPNFNSTSANQYSQYQSNQYDHNYGHIAVSQI